MTEIEALSEQDTSPHDRPFNPYRLPKSDKVKELIQLVISQMMSYENHFQLRRRKRREDDQLIFEGIVTAIICDLIHLYLNATDKKLYISLSKRSDNKIKRYSPASFSDTLPHVLKVLSSGELSFVEMVKGKQGHFGSSRQTTIKSGTRLVSRIKELDIDFCDLKQDTNQESIILKKEKSGHWDKGEWIDYDDNEITSEYRQQMQRINDWIAQAEITCYPLESKRPVDESERLLKRTFNNGSFESGGRLFGGFWQGLKKVERTNCLNINDQFVATLDYSQMAPKIAYSLVGVVPPDSDAYAITLYDNPRSRKSVKKVFNSLLYSDKPLNRFPKGTRDEFDKQVKFSHLMSKIEEAHQPIAHMFGTGIGLKIMFIESQILVRALLKCIDNNIIALPVHDALIVTEQDLQKTREIMLKAFREITNAEGQVEVE